MLVTFSYSHDIQMETQDVVKTVSSFSYPGNLRVWSSLISVFGTEEGLSRLYIPLLCIILQQESSITATPSECFLVIPIFPKMLIFLETLFYSIYFTEQICVETDMITLACSFSFCSFLLFSVSRLLIIKFYFILQNL